LSRAANPKQFLAILADRSMLQATSDRCVAPLFGSLLVVTGEDQRFFVADQMGDSAAPLEAILLEPCARNTASAVALAALWAEQRGEDEPMLVMPSDHLIKDVAALHSAVQAALAAALDGGIVTFGIRPTGPETGYGYIEAIKSAQGGAVPVSRFIEKPDQARAAQLAASPDHYWNAGIFLFRPSAMISELEQHAPEVIASVRTAVANMTTDGQFVRPEAAVFAAAPSISIDHAVMERTANAFVLPVDLGWSDVGSWDAVWRELPKDGDGNVLRGDVVTKDVRNSLIRSDGERTVAAIGLSDIVVVVTDDATFVAPIDRAQDTKQIVDQLRAAGNARADQPALMYRPWGNFQTVAHGPEFRTNRLTVKPGGQLSLQIHRQRSEHWIVVSGTAEVIIGGETSTLTANQSTYVPPGVPHRLSNPGPEPLHLIEVQCGSDLDGDIERIEDAYGRK
jgi:mannose-1-phosphate guanylyltransferase/mannose-6-phosphate isomerase